MDGDGDVAEHRLDTGGGHDEVRLVVIEGAVANGDELALDVFVDDLDVGDGGLEHRRPVDQAVGLIDQALVVELLEDSLDGARETIIKRKALAGPVHGVADGAHLVLNSSAVLALPLPDLLNEFVAVVVPAGLALGLLKLGLDLGLGRDTRVVRARQPQRGVALHALAADNRVDERVIQGVAHVQLTGDVRRRQYDGIRLGLGLGRRCEVARLHPAFVEVRFDRLRIPGLGQRVGAVGTN